LSYNKLKIHGECALKFRLAYIEKLSRPLVAVLAFHLRLHAALAQYPAFAKHGGNVREEERLDARATNWDARHDPSLREKKSY